MVYFEFEFTSLFLDDNQRLYVVADGIKGGHQLAGVASKLVDLANKYGGSDNITVIILNLS